MGKKVPVEEREYMRDQRAKVGTKGAFQMAGRDIRAPTIQIATDRREEMQPKKLHSQHLDEVFLNPTFASDVSIDRNNNLLVTGIQT
jgi:hypothetical protein